MSDSPSDASCIQMGGASSPEAQSHGLPHGLIRLYQRFLSPLAAALGARCRFHPSCSEYARQSIEKQGLVRGGGRALLRLLRCHPYCEGGIDLP